jgi:hypothetical protein
MPIQMPEPVESYTSFPYIFTSKGLYARYTIDRIPDHGYFNHDNAELRQENAIASRLGRHLITQNGTINLPLGTGVPIQTIARLNGLNTQWRYAQADADVYRRTGSTDGGYTQLLTPMPLTQVRSSVSAYRPSNTSYPYVFWANPNVMFKDNGSFATAERWGILPPNQPAIATVQVFSFDVIDSFEHPVSYYTTSGLTSVSQVSIVNTILGTAITTAPGTFTVTPLSMTNILPNSHLLVNGIDTIVVQSTTPTTFTAYFNDNHTAADTVVNHGLQGTVAATNTGYAQVVLPVNLGTIAGAATTNSDLINIGIQGGYNVVSATVQLDVGDGSFTQSYYTYTIPANQISGAFTEVDFTVGSMTAIGQAGLPGHTFADVQGWRITLDNTSTAPLAVTLNDFYLYGGSGPDITGGGVPYDYRYTYYNANTGDESGPSQLMITPDYVSPIRQPVEISWVASSDPQVTDVRVYRRGGTLPNQWLQVAQVPIGTTTFIDTLSDEQIADNNILDIDTAPPVTSTLPIPANTTLTAAVASAGIFSATVGSVQSLFINQVVTIDALTPFEENVVLLGVGVSFINAYFQYPHSIGATVQASTYTGFPVGIGTIAFDRAWLAGDVNNPNILYYSDRFNPESFPLENYLEIGTPTEPISAVLEWNGQLYVFTTTTVWNILGAQGGTVPLPYKTAAKHGLVAPFGWCIAEGQLFYQSFGGIYSFQGSVSSYVSEPVEWIFTDQFIDDTLERPVVPQNPTFINETEMAYYQNEVYISYIGTDGNRHRVIYHLIYNRWRNDDSPGSAMYVEDDIYTLLFGDDNGLIYQDRTNNFDDAGFIAGVRQYLPIQFNVQTAALDLSAPKNFKNFNELTLDIDTGGQTVNVILLLDYGLTVLHVGTATTNGRQQITYKINQGQGQLSLNVSLQLTATIQDSIPNPITIYESHIRAFIEAELRRSYDSYIMDFGSPDYNFVKQTWVEYMALDPAGITVNCYIEGGNVPAFSFTLPQSLIRVAKRVRLPATMARVWRWTATSNSDFRLYSDSRFEFRYTSQDKSQQPWPLQPTERTQP